MRPGSIRIASNTPQTLSNVAYKAPEGKRVVIVFNDGQQQQSFNIPHRGKLATSVLKGNAVGTFVW